MKSYLLTGILTVASFITAFAGNEDRVGSAGASELLINPWARSAAWADVGISCSEGIEAQFTNVAGLAFTPKTEVKFNYTNWLGTSGININTAGIAQKIGESNVIGVSVMGMTFGEMTITTVDLPEGGVGTFSPSYLNIAVSYAREFSRSIYGGITLKVINQSISNVKGTGVAFDAGIRYVTGEKDNIKFGIALKNVGPPMKYNGDGLAVESIFSQTGLTTTTEIRSDKFELPSLLNIGASYDILFNDSINTLTVAAAFTANSFTNDQYRVGLNYGFSSRVAAFNVMAGYVMEKGSFKKETRTTALTGLTAGVSVDILVGKKRSGIGIEYAYRHTNPFNGVHTIGARVNLR